MSARVETALGVATVTSETTGKWNYVSVLL